MQNLPLGGGNIWTQLKFCKVESGFKVEYMIQYAIFCLYHPAKKNLNIFSRNSHRQRKHCQHYGITGYEVSRPGIQNMKGFCIRINLPKENYWILRFGLMGSLSRVRKSELLKLIISFFHYFWCQNWDYWHKMSEKNTHIYFFYFRFKNKQVLAEKNWKKTKNFKNLKVTGN